MLVFFWRLASGGGVRYLTNLFPWQSLARFLNSLVRSLSFFDKEIEKPGFLLPEQGYRKPLPEDFLMRGQVWQPDYLPKAWFDQANATLEEDERAMEQASTVNLRSQRFIWLGIRFATEMKRQFAMYTGDESLTSSRSTFQSGKMERKVEPEMEEHRRLDYSPKTKSFSVVSKFIDSRHARVSQSPWNSANSAEADHGGAGPIAGVGT